MPYLHWETDTNRRKMAQAMVGATQKHRRYVQNSLPYSREDVREKFVQLAAKLRTKYTETVELPYDRKIDRKATLKPSQLGQYLLDAATLYDAMDVEPDVRLLRQHLHPLEHPPLHPRRTLDQSYHWKQESTELRDQDQVVYRHTKADSRIRRTAKLVMVDQLWLYVLDDSKCTTFPHMQRSSTIFDLLAECPREPSVNLDKLTEARNSYQLFPETLGQT
jgi:hypothetical protein